MTKVTPCRRSAQGSPYAVENHGRQQNKPAATTPPQGYCPAVGVAAVGHGVEWGLGWGLYKEMLWHWGDNGGFKSLVCLDPDTKDALLIHTNGFNGLNVCYDIAQLVTGESFADIAAMIAVAE